MKILLNNLEIECFENLSTYNDFIRTNGNSISDVKYHGTLYGTPPNIREMFKPDDLLAQVKRKVFHQTEYIIIHG